MPSSSFLESDCRWWFDFSWFELRCNTILIFGIGLLPVIWLPMFWVVLSRQPHFWNWIASGDLNPYILNGTVMPSSSWNCFAPTVWVAPSCHPHLESDCCQYLGFLQLSGVVIPSLFLVALSCYPHPWKQFGSSDSTSSSTSTSYSSSVAVTPSSFWERKKKRKNLLQVIWLPTVWVVLCHTYFS